MLQAHYFLGRAARADPQDSDAELLAAEDSDGAAAVIAGRRAARRARLGRVCRAAAFAVMAAAAALAAGGAVASRAAERSRAGGAAADAGGNAAPLAATLLENHADLGFDACGNSLLLNDFSSRFGMEAAGWWFGWDGEYSFKPLFYRDFAPPYSYWGFSIEGDGRLELRLRGTGVLTLDFGNLMGTPDSRVLVYLNLDQKTSAGPSVLSKTIDVAYQDADSLTIVQDGGIILINRIAFSCWTTTTTRAPREGSTSTSRENVDERTREPGRSDLDGAAGAEMADEVMEVLGGPKHGALAEAPQEAVREKEPGRFRAGPSRIHGDAAKEKERNERIAAGNSTQPQATLFCFTLMLPYGYEPWLLAAQNERQLTFWRCDERTIFSNSTTLLDKSGGPLPIAVDVIDISLAVDYGGKWHTALNAPVFNQVWQRVVDMGVYLHFAYTVKADIDCVWFPDRLRHALQLGVPEALTADVATPAGRRLTGGTCSMCRQKGREADTCEDHVRWLMRLRGKTCQEALVLSARPPPMDCGCQCQALEACDLSGFPHALDDGQIIRGNIATLKPAVYINNCRFGLHGPIEVLSAAAVSVFISMRSQCDFLEDQPWGEDKLMDRCLMAIGVSRVNLFGILTETACGEKPGLCGGGDVAFHPFKSTRDWVECWTSSKNSLRG